MQDEPALQAILTYLADKNPDPGHLLREGLALLVRLAGVDRTMLAIKGPFGLETHSWATPEGPASPEWGPMPATFYCQSALASTPAPLLVRDAAQDPTWQQHPAFQELGIRAYLGIPIGCPPLGVLSLHSASPRDFTEPEFLLAQGIATLFARLLEAGQLREEARRKDELLALHSAVADDHALEHPHSQLPTRRYLNVWVRANLSRARRSREKLGVAVFDSRQLPEEAQTLEKLLLHLRGEDILVDLGNHLILLAAPSANHQLLEGLLKRVHTILGAPLPIGATLCDPEKDLEGERPSLEPAIQRAHQALVEGLGSDAITWRMP